MILCDIEAFYFDSHNVPYLPLCLISPLLKPSATNQTSVKSRCKHTPPPDQPASRRQPSSPVFFIFFLNFQVSLCCNISYLYPSILCKIILPIIMSISMFCVDAFLCRLLLFPFVYLNNQREWGVRCAHSFFMLLSFYVFWIRHFSFIYIGYV